MKQKERLGVKGMHCASCALAIEEELEELAGVKKAKASFARQRVDVVFDDEKIDVSAICTRIAVLGYKAE